MSTGVGLWPRLFSCTAAIEKHGQSRLTEMDGGARERLYAALRELKRAIPKGQAS